MEIKKAHIFVHWYSVWVFWTWKLCANIKGQIISNKNLKRGPKDQKFDFPIKQLTTKKKSSLHNVKKQPLTWLLWQIHTKFKMLTREQWVFSQTIQFFFFEKEWKWFPYQKCTFVEFFSSAKQNKTQESAKSTKN